MAPLRGAVMISPAAARGARRAHHAARKADAAIETRAPALHRLSAGTMKATEIATVMATAICGLTAPIAAQAVARPVGISRPTASAALRRATAA